MAWISALTKLPWKLIVGHAPTIVDAARALYAGSRRAGGGAEPSEPPAGSLEALERALERLEAREVQHAALVADLARQLRDMATALEVLRARLRLALSGAAMAIVVAIVTAVLASR